MKALIFSLATGGGHHQTARAIEDALLKEGINTKNIDVIEYSSPILCKSVSQGYLMTTKYTPNLYGGAYRLLEKKPNASSSYTFTNFAITKRLLSLLESFAPDVIISTHVFAAELATSLRNKGFTRAKTIGIVTDFTIHPFWENTELDYYVIADELLTNQLVKKGISAKKAVPTGIPVHEKFSKQIEKEDASALLGIENKRTILVVMGSMGYGNLPKIIRKIDSLPLDFQILCVCGNSRRNFTQIKNLRLNKTIKVYGFVDNMDVFMSASDVIVTKPGGLTVSESLAKSVPIILMNPIPGQEDRNVEFLLNSGVASYVTSTFPIDEAIYQMFASDWKAEHVRKAVSKIGKPNATKDLVNFIKNLNK